MNQPESPSDSVIAQYIKTKVQDPLAKSPRGTRPKQYQDGTYWVHPKMPSFALETGANPNKLYFPRVFVWLPHYLLAKGDRLHCPYCDSEHEKKSVEVKQYQRPRRVIDISEYVLH